MTERANDTDDTQSPTTIGPAGGVALSRALLAALDDAWHVEGEVKRAGRALRRSAEALQVAWEASVRAKMAVEGGASAQRADTDEDAVFLALHGWLEGWSRLPARLAPESDAARALLRTLFPDGPGFTGMSYALEWAEADRVMGAIESDGTAAKIESLGGASMLHAVRTAHRAYEHALGVTHTNVEASDPAGRALASMVADLVAVMADYVAAARVDAVHADQLITPLRRWHAEQAAVARRSVPGQ